jgi:hypothetical protein
MALAYKTEGEPAIRSPFYSFRGILESGRRDSNP